MRIPAELFTRNYHDRQRTWAAAWRRYFRELARLRWQVLRGRTVEAAHAEGVGIAAVRAGHYSLGDMLALMSPHQAEAWADQASELARTVMPRTRSESRALEHTASIRSRRPRRRRTPQVTYG